ncbi:MAG: DNA polymerase III subunit chi [Betaproteobacteria bacterium]
MTEIAFHFNMTDKTDYVCRLLRKASAQGARVAVTGPQAALLDLDKALWSFSAVDFVPHCSADSPAAVREASPVLLGLPLDELPHHEVLLNLDAEVPVGFERFARVIEVVGSDDQERAQSRVRWKYYQQRGYPIVQHDMAGKESR